MTSLSSHPAQVLEELYLGYNSIGDRSIEYIAEYIKVCVNVSTFVKFTPVSLFIGGKLPFEDTGSKLH